MMIAGSAHRSYSSTCNDIWLWSCRNGHRPRNFPQNASSRPPRPQSYTTFSIEIRPRKPSKAPIPPRYLSSTAGNAINADIRRRQLADLQLDANGGFVYRIAASYCAKKRAFDPKKHYDAFDSATCTRTLAGKSTEPSVLKKRRPPSGQDACFISEIDSSGATAFGVADGVGGWQDLGINSADFSHGLCTYMAEAALHYDPAQMSSISPKKILQAGYEALNADSSIRGGGSTACIGIASLDGKLAVANLGDSGFVQMRLNKVHHYSNPQTHAFNTPFQLSSIPPKMLAQAEDFGGGLPFHDMPKDADTTHHELEHGDVLIFATDGVWDNLTSQDVLAIVSNKMVESSAWKHSDRGMRTTNALLSATEEREDAEGFKPLHSQIATSVVEVAKNASLDRRRDGPFARAVQMNYPEERFSGGKIDDICVVAIVVVDKDSLTSADNITNDRARL